MPISEMQARWATRVFKGIKHSADLLHRKLRAVLKIYVQSNKKFILLFKISITKKYCNVVFHEHLTIILTIRHWLFLVLVLSSSFCAGFKF